MTNDVKHKVFVSFHHKRDSWYKERFEELFSDIFIIKSVKDGDIDSDNSDDYIKRLIQEDYLSDSSVLIVLVGAATKGRKHVDWEISAALNKKVGGYSGLLAICIPDNPDYPSDKYNSCNIPARLADNLSSDYAKYYDWSESIEGTKARVENAFQARIDKSDLIKNSRIQMNEDEYE